MKKINIAVIFGGLSNERDVSLKTGWQIVNALPKHLYNVIPLEISRKNLWTLPEKLKNRKVDIVFIALHGKYGEDGRIQSLLELLQIPYTASGVSASAMGMNKTKCMEFLRKHGIKIPAFFVLGDKNYKKEEINKKIKNSFGYPCIIKPNESGSSIGVTILKNKSELSVALKKAFAEDEKVIVQKYIEGRELTCAILGGADPAKLEVLPIIEIVVHDSQFFDYKTKYFSKTVEEICPADINSKLSKKIKNISKKVHRILGCDGLTRSDFILSKSNTLYFLEINTIPGQTEASLCPKAAKVAGMNFSQFIERQIELALEKS